jgi:hypothetical protein
MPEFLQFLATLLCDQQDQDTVHEVATQHWFPHDKRSEIDQCVTVQFTRTGSGLHACVRTLDAETSEIQDEQHWRIEARPA